jgi:hypothetical protein
MFRGLLSREAKVCADADRRNLNATFRVASCPGGERNAESGVADQTLGFDDDEIHRQRGHSDEVAGVIRHKMPRSKRGAQCARTEFGVGHGGFGGHRCAGKAPGSAIRSFAGEKSKRLRWVVAAALGRRPVGRAARPRGSGLVSMAGIQF